MDQPAAIPIHWNTGMQIADLEPNDAAAIEQAAQALVAGFREQAPDAWPDLAAARTEVQEALEPGKVCRSPVTRMALFLAGSAGTSFMRACGSCTPW